MEYIISIIEELLVFFGLTGRAVPIARHISMVVVAILLAWMAKLACSKLIVPLIVKLASRTETKWGEVLFNQKVLHSACQIVPAIVIWQLLPLVFFQYPIAREVLTRLTAIYITVTSVKLAVVFINSFKDLDSDRRTSAQQYFVTFCGVLKIIIMFIAAIITVAILLGKSPLTLFAGLGATSAILMLVFKETLEGLVAGIRLTSNEMVHKGDWITVPGTEANGIVQEMSLSTVKVQNFDNTIVTLSPTTLINGSFQNWKGMQESAGRRVTRQIYFDFRSIRRIDAPMRQRLIDLGYFKPEELTGESVNITLFRNYAEKFLASRKEINPDMTLMVRQREAKDTGLPVEFYFFIKNKEWVTYEHALADIMEGIFSLTKDFELEIYQKYPLH